MWIALGSVYLSSGAWQDAIDSYSHARKLDPNNPTATYNLALAAVRMNDAGLVSEALQARSSPASFDDSRSRLLARPRAQYLHSCTGIRFISNSSHDTRSREWTRHQLLDFERSKDQRALGTREVQPCSCRAFANPLNAKFQHCWYLNWDKKRARSFALDSTGILPSGIYSSAVGLAAFEASSLTQRSRALIASSAAATISVHSP